MTGKTPSADSRIPCGPHADSSPFALSRRPPSVPKRERPAELWPPLAAASGRPVAGSLAGQEGTPNAANEKRPVAGREVRGWFQRHRVDFSYGSEAPAGELSGRFAGLPICRLQCGLEPQLLSLIHISEPTRLG